MEGSLGGEGERPQGSGMASASQDRIGVGNTTVEDEEKVGPTTWPYLQPPVPAPNPDRNSRNPPQPHFLILPPHTAKQSTAAA